MPIEVVCLTPLEAAERLQVSLTGFWALTLFPAASFPEPDEETGLWEQAAVDAWAVAVCGRAGPPTPACQKMTDLLWRALKPTAAKGFPFAVRQRPEELHVFLTKAEVDAFDLIENPPAEDDDDEQEQEEQE